MLQPHFPKLPTPCCVTALSGSDQGICRGLVLGFCLSLNCCSKLFWVSACHFRGTSGLKSTLHKALEQSPESSPASLHCCIQLCLMRWPDSLTQVHLSLLKGKFIHWGCPQQDPAASPWGQAPKGSGHSSSLTEFKKLLEALSHVVWLLGMVLLGGWSRWSLWSLPAGHILWFCGSQPQSLPPPSDGASALWKEKGEDVKQYDQNGVLSSPQKYM